MENQENGFVELCSDDNYCSNCQAKENLFDDDWDIKVLDCPSTAIKRVMEKLNKINEKLDMLLENDD